MRLSELNGGMYLLILSHVVSLPFQCVEAQLPSLLLSNA